MKEYIALTFCLLLKRLARFFKKVSIQNTLTTGRMVILITEGFDQNQFVWCVSLNISISNKCFPLSPDITAVLFF